MAILSLIADTMDELTAQCENYWCGFGTLCEAKGYNARGFEKVQSLAWYDDLIHFLQEHKEVWQEMRNSLNDEARGKLEAIENMFIQDLEEIKKEVAGYVLHWTLRDHIYQWRCWIALHWEAGWLCIESDWLAVALV